MRRLGLGSAQFGMDYGIANKSGRVGYEQAERIIEDAEKSNINLIDTAIAYGECETILGKIGVKRFDIVTKLPPIAEDCIDVNSWVEEQVVGSLERLNVTKLYGLLVHRPADLHGKYGQSLLDGLLKMKSQGLVSKVGASVYSPMELNQLVLSLDSLDLIQSPLSVIDRRLVNSGWLSNLSNLEIEVHVRSVFLQGLLLMEQAEFPKQFAHWKPLWDNWSAELERQNVSAASACLSYPLSFPEVSRVLLGVDKVEQIRALVLASKDASPTLDFSFMAVNDEALINPSKWSRE